MNPELGDVCENCESLRRYAFAQMRLADRLQRRAAVAEGALAGYMKAAKRTGGIHHSLYRPGHEGKLIDRLAQEMEARNA